MNRTIAAGVAQIVVAILLGGVYYWRAAAAVASSPLLLIPVVLLFSLGVTTLFVALRPPRGSDAPAQVADVWPRTRALTTVMAMALLSLGLCGFGLLFLQWDVVTESAVLETAVLAVLLLVALSVGGINLRRALSLPAEEMAPIRHLLEKQPEQIAWAYKFVVAAPAEAVADDEKMATVCLWLADGRSYHTTLPPDDAEALLAQVRARAPHAAIGYDTSIEAKYRQDPTCFMPPS